MAVILVMCYMVYEFVEISNMSKQGISSSGIARCIWYGVMIGVTLLALMKMGEKANIAIVDSISMLSQLSEEVSAGTASSKETLNGTMEKMQGFSDIVQNTFKQLLILEETTTE